jgi:hypothetical protein
MPVSAAQSEHIAGMDRIAYCSLASPSVHALSLVRQLKEQRDITGLLIWEGRLLIHWLEGSPSQIETLWAVVQNDPQQHCVVQLLRQPYHAKRLFADWQMRPTSRQEMMVIVRKAKEQASHANANQEQALQWQHGISTLSILLNPQLTRFYAQATAKEKSEHEVRA